MRPSIFSEVVGVVTSENTWSVSVNCESRSTGFAQPVIDPSVINGSTSTEY